jgi:hypothetical protein
MGSFDFDANSDVDVSVGALSSLDSLDVSADLASSVLGEDVEGEALANFDTDGFTAEGVE